MATVTQISNNPSLFSDTSQRVLTSNGSYYNSLAGVSQTSQEEAEELQEQFLQILLTQLQNQNPLDPVDTTEYTNQLVQYSALEQQIDTNLRLSNILDTLQVGSSLNAFAYVGNNVELLTQQSALQDGEAEWTYALASDADAVEVTILNQNGTKVYEENLGGQSSGSYGFSFNADEASIPLAEGEPLLILLNAKTDEGVDVEAQVSTVVRVSAVETAPDGSVLLRAGGLSFGIDDISKVLEQSAV